MSALSNKILSFSPDYFVRFNQAYTTAPTNLGTDSPTSPLWSLSNEAPVYLASSGVDSEGSWRFNVGANGDTTTTRYQTTAQYISTLKSKTGFGTYSIGFWFKVDPALQALSHSNPAIYVLQDLFNAGSATVDIGGNTATSINKGKLLVSTNLTGGTTVGTPITTNRVDDGNWHYVHINRTRTQTSPSSLATIEFYLDGQLFYSRTNGTWTPSGTFTVRFGNTSTSANMGTSTLEIHNVYLKSGLLTAAQILEIWESRIAATSYPLKYWNGTAWTTPLSITQWNGTSWTTFNGKVWNGSTWFPIGL